MEPNTESLLVVGSYAVGLTMRAARAPGAGETVLGTEFDEGPGGKGSNQAVQGARMAAPTALVAAIGTDRFGDDALALWEREAIDVADVTRSAEPTGAGLIIVDDAGENRIVLYPGANATLDPAHVDAAVRRRRPAVLIVQLEIPLSCVAAAVLAGRAVGAVVVLNPAPANAELVATGVLAQVDVVTPNQSEARVLVGRGADDPVDDAAVAVELAERGARTVVMTRGADGALVHVPGADDVLLASERVDVVDSTGAGDAFNGTFAAALARGEPLTAAAAAGVRAGARACLRLGVIPSLPVLRDLPVAGEHAGEATRGSPPVAAHR